MLRTVTLTILAAALAATALPAQSETTYRREVERSHSVERWSDKSASVRIVPPAPPAVRHHHRHRAWDSDDNYWAVPLAIGGAWLGYQALKDRDREPQVIEHRYVPTEPQTHIWYWCESEQAYYPSVKACPFGWTEVPSQSATTPPAPPAAQ